MRFSFFVRPLAAAALTLTGLAGAQTSGPAAGSTPISAATWQSAFDGYRNFADAPVAPWRESNDTVGRIGGWRAYAREAAGAASEPVTPRSSSPGAPAAGAPVGGGHRH